MSTPEEQVDTSTPVPPTSALDSLQAPGLKKQASAFADQYFKSQLSGENTRGEAALFQQQDADAEQARQALRQAREKLASQRLDPSVLGLRFAQAMMAPSRYGIPDQWSKAAGTVADWRQQNQEFQQGQDKQDLSLQEQLSNVDAQSLKSRLALQELRERTGAQTADTALKILAKPAVPPGQDKLTEMDTPEGGKQYAWVSPSSHTITPTGPKVPPKGSDADPTAIDFGAYKLYKTNQMTSLGTGSGPARMAILAGAARYAQREAAGEDISNPGYDQAISNGQDFTAGQHALSSFAGGPLGNQTRALNNSVGHLKLYEDTFDALNNGDVQALNKLGNAWNKAFGAPAPTTLQAMGQIIGPELTKILTNTNAGTGEERGQFATTAGGLANAPEQTKDAIDKVRGMLGRQAADLALQYHGATQRNDFAKRYLAPDVAEALQLNPDTAAQTTPKTATTPTANAKGWVLHVDKNGNKAYVSPDGKQYEEVK